MPSGRWASSRVRSNVESLVVIAAACGRQHVPVAFLPEDARDLIGELARLGAARRLARGAVRSGRGTPAACVSLPPFRPQVVVATSGTSGPPKLVEHSWDSLLAAARLAEQWHGLGWLLVYDATRWAGLQVWLQAVLTAGRARATGIPEPRCRRQCRSPRSRSRSFPRRPRSCGG
jgi:acyl-coenzyme A synthetase/AMP-(fatty) acid ligase